MKNSIADIRKKNRGRPRRPTTPVLVRFSDSELTALDRWIAETGEKISRPEAARRLIQTGLELHSVETQNAIMREIGNKNITKEDINELITEKRIKNSFGIPITPSLILMFISMLQFILSIRDDDSEKTK